MIDIREHEWIGLQIRQDGGLDVTSDLFDMHLPSLFLAFMLIFLDNKLRLFFSFGRIMKFGTYNIVFLFHRITV